MRLEFKILWFENQPQDVKTQLEEITEHIESAGFVPSLDIQEDAAGIGEIVRRQRLYDEYDLVVVDYDLGSHDMNGDHVAQLVRQGFGFTDIIFYSGSPTAKLREMVFSRQIDGVYCLPRPELADKLAVHIDQAVKRMSRLEAMRGLSMATVGKCDDQFRAILNRAFNGAQPAEQDAMMGALDEMVQSAAKVQGDRYSRCETYRERIESRAVTSFHLHKAVLNFTKGKPEYATYREVLKSYDLSVLQPRNTLGHAIEVQGVGGWEVPAGGNPAIGSEAFPALRRDLARHLSNIQALGEAIGVA